MDTLIQHASTFTTVYLTDTINMENRILSNSIIAILTLLLVQTITYGLNNWRDVYNCVVYHVYGMHKYPLEIWRAPYLYTFQANSDSFIENHMRRHVYGYLQTEDLRLGQFSNLFAPLINKNKCTPLHNADGTPIKLDSIQRVHHAGSILKDDQGGVYLIAIDSYGCPVYYSTQGLIFYKCRTGFLKLDPYLHEYLEEEYRKQSNTLHSSNGIYVLDAESEELQMIGNVCKKKTFDTLFYTQKDELMNLLHKFKTNTLYPPHVPMDNKLGILLHGPPGTGKTGTISAIANYLGRSITVINFSEINKCEELNKLLDPANYDKTVFVFDEFDCLLDVLSGNEKKDQEKTDWGSMLLVAEGEERKEILNMLKEGRRAVKQTLNIAYLLQKLDGLESAEGRIIVATTNNPDKINPALLRPGRFDIKLCLGNCTHKMYAQILENYYKDETDVYVRVMDARIQEFKHTPLELLNLAMQHSTLESLLGAIAAQ